VFVFGLNGSHFLDDGQHRCIAAALLGRQSIPAVVFTVTSDEERAAFQRCVLIWRIGALPGNAGAGLRRRG
jgi:hypothetical protein